MMIKIIVDEMPKCAVECPFSTQIKFCFNGCLLKEDGDFCSCEYDANCQFLMELPKGDRENGSSQD